MRPRTPKETQILQVWKELMPVDAYSAGIAECAGGLFIPNRQNRDRGLKDLERLKQTADSESERKLLACLSSFVELLEPEQIPGSVSDAFFGHMVKEGIRPAHLASLAEYSAKALRETLPEIRKQTLPIGIRVLTQIRCDSVREILEVVTKSSKNRTLREKVSALQQALNEFTSAIAIPDFKNESFDEVYVLIKEKGCELGRAQYYAQALRDLYDYPESPQEVEEKGLQFLRNELDDFNTTVSELSTRFGSEPLAEELTKAIRKQKSLNPQRVIAFLKELRTRAVRVIHRNLVAVNPKYKTKVIETPRYLTGILPSGAALFLDYLTSKPSQFFLTTTDPRRSPHTVPSELLNLLVHEEYGHCVHASNSATHFGAKPIFIEMLSTHLGSAVSEGLSFQRELEFLEYLTELGQSGPMNSEEKSFTKFWDRYDGFEKMRAEYAFFTKMWRIVRFLRVIGDARINAGKQSLPDFIDWANRETGLSKSLVYHQVFPAHQGIGPGYASTYAMLGESIRQIQKPLKVGTKDFVKFNTYACSQGFPARTIFEQRLRSIAQ